MQQPARFARLEEMSIHLFALLVSVSALIAGCGGMAPAAGSPSATVVATSSPLPPRSSPTETAPPTRTPEPAQAARLAFSASAEGGSPEIWVMNADGTDRRVLTESAPDEGAYGPTWSPDGTEIAFGIGRPQSEIFAIGIVGADGSNQRVLGQGIGASWSPDGRALLFQEATFTAPNLYVVEWPDGEPRALTIGTGGAWSPDGTRIAFTTQPDDDVQRIALINPDGTGLVELVPGYAPQWSPDGERLTFFAGRAEGGFEVRVVDVDGSDEQVLAEGEQPRWSPNGSRIAFVRTDVATGELQLWVVSADGSGAVQMPFGDYDFAWSPDGSQLAVGVDADGDDAPEIHVMAADGSDDVVLGPGDSPAWSPTTADQ